MHALFSRTFFLFASMALAAAMYGWGIQDIWLASTQWMQVATVFLLMAIFVKMSEEDDKRIEEEMRKIAEEKAKNAPKSKKKDKKDHKSFKLSK